MSEKNFDEHIRAAELQLANKDNNPTFQQLLLDLHKGINHYKEKAEQLSAELAAAKADMKSIAQGIDGCEFCKNTPPDFRLCDDVGLDCEKCTADCNCRFCSTNGNFNFQWRGRV